MRQTQISILISCNYLDAPVCSSGSRQVFGVARQERVAVTCEVNANPVENMKFDWIFSKGDEKLDMQQSQIRWDRIDILIFMVKSSKIFENFLTFSRGD